MVSLISQFATSSSGLGALGLNFGSFVIQLITFIIALLVLKKWAFKPIMRLMNERRETIAKGVELGEQMKKDKQELDAKVETELQKARDKADAIIAAAHDSAKESIRQAEADAATRAEGIISSAKEQTKQDIENAKKKLESEIVGMVAAATEVLTREKVDTKKDAGLIARALALKDSQ